MAALHPWLRKVAPIVKGHTMTQREIGSDIEVSGGWYSIAVLFAQNDARRIGTLRAQYTKHHDVPYNRLMLFDKCPPSMTYLYKQTLMRHAAENDNFMVRMTNPYVRSHKHGDKAVCIGVASEELSRLHIALSRDLATVLAPSTQRHEMNAPRKVRHALVVEKKIPGKEADLLVQRIIAEQPPNGLGEVEISGLLLKFNKLNRKVTKVEETFTPDQKIFHFNPFMTRSVAEGKRMRGMSF